MKEIEILRSEDGERFEPVGKFTLERAPGSNDDRGQQIAFSGVVDARFIEIRTLANHGGNHVGLAEVRFSNADKQAEAPGAWTPRYERPTHPKLEPGQPLPDGENFIFPADARVVDVTRAPYHAKGDGQTDDTAAIQRALDDHPSRGAIIYLPNGIYRISDTLRWPGDEDPRASNAQKNTALWGQSREGTVIQLRDAAPGFENPRQSRALIWTGKAPAQRFANEVHNLTLDTGVDNPGASGAMFIANNQGGMYNVSIVSGDGQGVAGLNLAYSDEQGPLLIKNVSVKGFDVGISAAHSVASMTFEHISVEQQNAAGFQNDGHPVSIRGLSSRNRVPAVLHNGGLMVLIDSDLQGLEGAADSPAILSSGTLFARDIRSVGYAHALHDQRNDRRVADLTNGEYRSDPPRARVTDAANTLRLEIKETPEVPWDAHSQWIAPQAFGEVDRNRDNSALIQQAIDSGKTTVYLPLGAIRIDETVVIRGDVRRIIGTRPWLIPGGKVAAGEAPMFRFENGTHPVVVFEGIGTGFNAGVQLMEHAAERTLVLRRVMSNFQGGTVYSNSGKGDLFIEDMVGGTFHFNGQRVWARQFNPEPQGTKVINDGGTLWVLGMKWERPGSALVNRGGPGPKSWEGSARPTAADRPPCSSTKIPTPRSSSAKPTTATVPIWNW
ncbi:MAG: glycosyl hydrolase family 28-related protein [Opitutales bacterium]